MDKYNYRLTPNKLTRFGWTEFPKPIPDNEFSFIDWDHLTVDHSGKYERRDYRIMLGRPRYTISFYKQSSNRKKPTHVSLEFNDKGYYERYHVGSNYMSLKTEHQWIAEAFERLCELGVIEKCWFNEQEA